MIRLPRLALATCAEGPEPAPASMALLAGLSKKRWRVQHFRSRACPTGSELVGQLTGLPGRHLDAWLMPPDLCRAVFLRGARRADLALVEGTLHPARPGSTGHMYDCAGQLGPIADSLGLPTVAVVSCAMLEGLHLPSLPEEAEAVLLDGLENPSEFEALKRTVSLLLRRPVIGAIEALPEVRAALRQTPPGQSPSPELFERLAASFLRFADLPVLRTLAESRPFPSGTHEPQWCPLRQFRIAYAQDDAFGGYFPDTLETLEALGAELIEFSPLRDEWLPESVDLVMIGCGMPDLHAEALAANLSLIAALRAHVCQGRRLYSEGGGTAYLGRTLLMGERRIPGAGILPFDAELLPQAVAPRPVERVLERDGWLGPKGTTVRGYRSCRWRLRAISEPYEYCPGRSGTLTAQRDMYFRHHAVGSLIHLHLTALPHVVAAFAGPHQPSLALP
jgi:cobyrinic acid a,c-diamide synthase